MENCISTARRILRFLDILKSNQDGLEFSRIVGKQIESLTTPIIDLRNTIAHMDKKIQNDAIQENDPIMLKITDTQDGIMRTGQLLEFSTLSTLLKQLHTLGRNMAQWCVEEN